MKEKESLWNSSLESKKILGEVKDEISVVLKTYESRIATIERSILAVLEFRENLSSIKIKSLDDFLNFYLFINTFQLDISVVLHRYLLSTFEYELVFFGKSSASLIFEYLDSIHLVFNKFAKSGPTILQDDINSIKIILKQFAKIKKKYPQLKEIRNMIAAHRHHNSFEYLKISTEMDSYEYIKLILEIMKVNSSLTITVLSSLKKIHAVFRTTLHKK